MAHWVVAKLDPVDSPVHHDPSLNTRPVRSDLPSPLKSPTCTSTQVTVGDQLPHRLVVKDEPVDMPTHQFPVPGSRPAISVRPSPLKSPVTTFVQLTAGFH